jgi:tetratricopeptide (TPR) repeat protein
MYGFSLSYLGKVAYFVYNDSILTKGIKMANKNTSKSRQFVSSAGKLEVLAKNARRGAKYLALAGLVGVVGNTLGIMQSCTGQEKKVVANELSRGKIYEIKNKKDFDDIYKAAMPFICLSMFPTETLNLGVYADKGDKKNTIGLGSYWYPKNGEPTSSKWIKVSEHDGVQAEGFSISGNRAMDMVDSWARHRENGRVYREMCKSLIGTKLSLNEFAAIFTCTYNNEKNGKMLCAFVKNNYNNPIKCASYLVNLKTYGFSGLLDRHCHEALIYLNLDNYIFAIQDMQIQEFATSVTALEKAEFMPMVKSLDSGKLDGARAVANKIKKRIFKHGRTVSSIINEKIGGERAKTMLASPSKIASGNKTFSQNSSFNANNVYETGLAKYKTGDYKGALAVFQSIIKKGFDGADIHNDLAITYYHLKEYSKAIEESRLVLKMGEREAYSPANFNAGLAYEKLGDLEKAAANFNAAVKRSPQVEAYKNALKRVNNEITKRKSKTAVQNKANFDNAKTKTAVKQTARPPMKNQKAR